MSEAQEPTAEETTEPTLEEFVADMDAEVVSEATEDEAPVEEQPAEAESEPVQTFDVNGEQVTIDELQKGYMRTSDYTKKTQEVARAREEAEAMREALNRFYEEPVTPGWEPEPPGMKPAYDTPEFVTDAERILYEKTQKMEQAVAALAADKHRREKQEALQNVDNTLFGYQKDNPDLTDEQIVQISRTVRQRGYPYTQDSFDMVRKATMAPSVEEIRKQAVADYIEQQKALKAKSEQAALEPGNVPAADEPPPDIRTLSQEQIDALATEEFRQMMGG
jgi:hypothetical protein